MTRRACVPVLLASLLLPVRVATSWAAFHISHVDEVMSGLNGDPAAQYVEIKLLAGGQTAVSHTRLTAFSCDGTVVDVLLEVPQDVCHGAAGLRWTMGTASWATATGVAPDFQFPPGIFTPCGQICWGAPGVIPPNPPMWDASNPNNYVDCVAYGPYTGPRQTSDAAATTLPPGDGTLSLQRMADTGNDLADFALAPRTPDNNGCAMTTTTTLPRGGGGACTDAAAMASTRAQVTAQCDCAGAPNHGTYVKCAAAVAKTAVRAGALPRACKGAVKRCAAKSTCGKRGFVACCRTTSRGAQKCSIKRTAAACKPPKGGSACVGDVSSCCDACGGTTCPTVTTTTTRTGTTLGRTTTTHARTSTTAAMCAPSGRSCATNAECCSRYCYLGQCY